MFICSLGQLLLQAGAGLGLAAMLVKRFIKAIPKEHCSNPYVDASLSNTYWRLTLLKEQPLRADTPMRREAHLIFKASKEGAQNVVSGSTGCNTFSSSYEAGPRSMTIAENSMAMTKMACPADNIEREFISILGEVSTWKIKGDHLELYGNDEESVLARFEATYLY